MPKFSRKRGVGMFRSMKFNGFNTSISIVSLTIYVLWNTIHTGKQAAGKKGYRKSLKTANRSKDIDQIQDELHALNNPLIKLPFYTAVRDLPIDNDLPGQGQYYCRYCAKYFLDESVQLIHNKTKIHKKRMKVVNSTPYSQADADSAAGMGATQKTLHT